MLGHGSAACRTRLVALLVCATTTVACALAGSALASTPPPSYYGANIQPLIKLGLVPETKWSGFLGETMGRGDLKTARADAEWSWAEPTAPVDGKHTYVWSNPSSPSTSMDNLVATLAANGVRMLAVLSTAPEWAGGSGKELLPVHYADLISFAAAFAARYGAGGTFWAQNPKLPYLPVEQFELWTEANSSNFWTGSPNAAEYLKVLGPLTAAVHAVDPSGQVLASIGWENFQPYVTQLYQDGGKAAFDGIAFHPYAPDAYSIVLLTEELRATLQSAGDPNLPIYDTETGLPAAPSGPGATFAYDGDVSDAARAATLSLAGDALAHGDCGVQSFDIYGLIGSGTNLEPAQEGYMGMFNDITGVPNLTGSAIIAANQRWQADPSTGLIDCGAGATPSSALLPLGVTLTHASPTCVSAVVTYYGNPLEGAELVLRTADGRVDPAGTNAFGQTQMCLQNGPPITTFTVYAELSAPATQAALTAPDIAASPTYTCPVTSAACVLGTPAAPAASPTSSSAPPTSSHPAETCTLRAALVGTAEARATLRALLSCPVAKQPAAPAHLWVVRLGQTRRRFLENVTLRSGRSRTITLRVRLSVGDRIGVTVPADRALARPRIQALAAATRKLVRGAARRAGAAELAAAPLPPRLG
jgi:hypothetical protein